MSGADYSGYKSKDEVGGWALYPHEMEHLIQVPYMYNASAGSYLELLFLQRFWMRLSKLVPDHVAPCVLTCLGIVINVVTCLILLYYSPDMRGEVPSWAFVLAAIGLFLYQTLDALDGKVAIAKQNTQIEEVYDHGCDAISTIFVTMATAVAAQLGRHPFINFVCFLMSSAAFFSTHWLCHIKHQMVFGKIDVSEAQIMMVAVHLITAYFGQGIWHSQVLTIAGLRIELVHVLAILTIFGLARAVFLNVHMSVLGGKTPLERLGIHIPVQSGVHIWYPLVPVAMLIGTSICAYRYGYFVVSPTIFCLTFGLAFAKITIKLVMKNVSHGIMELTDTSLIGPALIALNAMIPLMRISTALTCGLFLVATDITRYFTYASWDLKVALGLNIFTLKYPPGHTKCRNGNYGFYINGLNNEEILTNPRANLPKGYDGGVTFDFE